MQMAVICVSRSVFRSSKVHIQTRLCPIEGAGTSMAFGQSLASDSASSRSFLP